jgi:hypothetical protein
VNDIRTIVLDDSYAPLDEFKNDLKDEIVQRKLTCFTIVLSLSAPKDTKVAGYQSPIPASEVGPDQGPDDVDQV